MPLSRNKDNDTGGRHGQVSWKPLSHPQALRFTRPSWPWVVEFPGHALCETPSGQYVFAAHIWHAPLTLMCPGTQVHSARATDPAGVAMSRGHCVCESWSGQ